VLGSDLLPDKHTKEIKLMRAIEAETVFRLRLERAPAFAAQFDPQPFHLDETTGYGLKTTTEQRKFMSITSVLKEGNQ
jgi:hypothetical protein